ncbi:peptidoglycan-binding protein [Streptomyces sp. C10-9-1]|uniref:peptidoglycan-binding domain-containing protein n=1 Tax=Streptomyces sp. C10-9-1 TaxID=1859285 RepID=UPI002112CD9C|nr:peptidoglycan-binding domain-containing protein [Streptomyces sp. C10-9-1]MCQ6553176.1 peptidoglycan-binding protein [Streptomyces sp. C10-9-1]
MLTKKLTLGLSTAALLGVGALGSPAVASPAPAANGQAAVMSVPGCLHVGSHAVVKYGDSNRHVKHAQCLLRKVKGYNVAMDGIFGAKTRSAVIKAQKRCYPNRPAEWDGIVGNKTWACLHYKL